MTKTHRSRLGSASRVIAVTGLMAMVFALLPFTAATAAHLSGVTELQADGNIEAAIAYSQATYPQGDLDAGDVTAPSEALIGRSDIFPDNLASGALQDNTPLLLTDSNNLSQETADELQRLGVTSVTILGGENAVSADVEAELADLVGSVDRLAGETRIETAIEVTEASGASTAILARAYDAEGGSDTAAFADALAAGGWAADAGYGVLLSQTDELTDSVADFLSGNQINTVIIVGGTEAISASTASEVEGLVDNVERVSGPNRAATAVAIAQERGYPAAEDAPGIILVDGFQENSWASGFPAANLSALQDYPIVLSNGDDLPPETEAYVSAQGNPPADGTTDGGTTDGGTTQAATTDLVCGPFTSAAACAEAAALLGIVDINLNVTTVEAGGVVSGLVSGDVASLTVDGCGLTGQDVTINDDDTFSFTVPANQPEGTCELTLTATTSTGDTVTFTFAITVTGRAAAVGVTDAPELVLVTIVDASTGVVRYDFDEEVVGTAAGAQGFFRLYQFNGTAQFPTAVRIEGSSVFAQFTAAQVQNTTLGTVQDGAVFDVSGRFNPVGAEPVQNVTLAAGITIAPDLVAIGNLTQDAQGRQTVDFTFDEAVTTAVNPMLFTLVGSDATEYQPSDPAFFNLTNSNRTVTLEFSPTGIGDEIPFSQIVRGYVRPGAVSDGTYTNVLHAEPVAAAGITVNPDLVSATAISSTQIQFDFDEAVDAFALNPANFFAYTSGNESVGQAPTQTAANTVERSTTDPSIVTATFAAGIVSNAVGASVEDSAARASDNTNTVNAGFNRPDETPLTPVEFQAGITSLPDLVSCTKTQDPVTQNWTVTYTFDQAAPVTLFEARDFHLYDATGQQFVNTKAPVQAGPNAVSVSTGGTSPAFNNAQVESAVLCAVIDESNTGAQPDFPEYDQAFATP